MAAQTGPGVAQRGCVREIRPDNWAAV